MFTVSSLSLVSFIKHNTKCSGLSQRCVIEKHITRWKGPLRKSVYDKRLSKKKKRQLEITTIVFSRTFIHLFN